ncbi:hypothetical protein FA10DRAFT_99593 [Acaromyces ingoldii]|uniref:Uncharacterized protein n=1 Tax=Acaromyces ingoldii TaxID=215250 RepID=A0A316YPA1_9BASI|nr:hypothetical protein FA10DRAFT_99593 [Acaromyces ingoldii]PWN89883.1 hypothetical protein FA10DRAFT_99593 [Acaromyces ingoldii]
MSRSFLHLSAMTYPYVCSTCASTRSGSRTGVTGPSTGACRGGRGQAGTMDTSGTPVSGVSDGLTVDWEGAGNAAHPSNLASGIYYRPILQPCVPYEDCPPTDERTKSQPGRAEGKKGGDYSWRTSHVRASRGGRVRWRTRRESPGRDRRPSPSSLRRGLRR